MGVRNNGLDVTGNVCVCVCVCICLWRPTLCNPMDCNANKGLYINKLKWLGRGSRLGMKGSKQRDIQRSKLAELQRLF